ncbi:MAG: hemerythrin family protein [Sulfurimonas sp.]|nr:hemerythrin family protein [Sulfurimonas sp.]
MPHQKKVHWEDNYSIGIDFIDTQHQKLFEIVNKLYDLEESPNIKEEIREILYAFKDYTIVHFRDEEEYMKSIGYPGLQKHHEIHEQIIESLATIIQKPAKLSIIKTKMRVVAKRILIDHIINEDQKIAVYAREQDTQEEIFSLDEL